MTSETIRDPGKDHLLTPANSAFIIIDYQPMQVNSIPSMDRQLLVRNVVRVAKTAMLLVADRAVDGERQHRDEHADSSGAAVGARGYSDL